MRNLKDLQIRYPISLAKNSHAHDQFTKGARCAWSLCSFPLSKSQKLFHIDFSYPTTCW